MRVVLRQLYRRLDRSHPRLGAVVRKLYYRRFSRHVRRVIKGNDNTVSYDNATLTSVFFDIKGSGNRIDIGEGCRLNNVVFHVVGDNHRVLIAPNCVFSSRGTIWLEDRDGLLTIGQGSTFADVHLALTEPGSRMTIGRDCMFSKDIDVRTGDSHSIVSRKTGERVNYAQDVHVGDHVWVGAHSVILKGTSIADNSVVATGSIVTGRHEMSGVILGGNPAKQLRTDVTWCRERIYRCSQASSSPAQDNIALRGNR
jgi:acetyltransferase-like isoleucine patch superfamily enzyme